MADYEKFYPKEKKEVPKGEEKKSESKGNEMKCVIVSCVLLLVVFIADVMRSVLLMEIFYDFICELLSISVGLKLKLYNFTVD